MPGRALPWTSAPGFLLASRGFWWLYGGTRIVSGCEGGFRLRGSGASGLYGFRVSAFSGLRLWRGSYGVGAFTVKGYRLQGHFWFMV